MLLNWDSSSTLIYTKLLVTTTATANNTAPAFDTDIDSDTTTAIYNAINNKYNNNLQYIYTTLYDNLRGFIATTYYYL